MHQHVYASIGGRKKKEGRRANDKWFLRDSVDGVVSLASRPNKRKKEGEGSNFLLSPGKKGKEREGDVQISSSSTRWREPPGLQDSREGGKRFNLGGGGKSSCQYFNHSHHAGGGVNFPIVEKKRKEEVPFVIIFKKSSHLRSLKEREGENGSTTSLW